MNVQDVETLVAELLATGDMNEDTKADLERILTDVRSGQSHSDDLDYLRALHGRVLNAPASEEAAPSVAPSEGAEDLRAEIAQLRAELAEARQTIAELETRLASGV